MPDYNDNNYTEEPREVETKEETDRKCPRCGGVMSYDPMTGGLFCPFCEYKEEIKNEDEPIAESDFYSAISDGNCDWGAPKKTVVCEACGANIIYDALEISNECPYCGSNHVMEAKGENTLAPGGVVPFIISVEEASKRFFAWIKRRFFCPRAAKQSVKPEAFKGLYMPYWTFDSDTSSTYTARYGKDRTVKDRDGKETTRTDWYHTSGMYSKFIDDQAVCGSARDNSSMMSRVEPYDTSDNKPYKPEYVAGFLSERYSVSLKDAWEKAKVAINGILRGDISEKVRRQYNADHVDSVNIKTNFTNIKYKYLLLPVWISCFKYKDKVYNFMVNGQTGKVGGKTPISAIRVILTVLAAIAVVALLMVLFGNE